MTSIRHRQPYVLAAVRDRLLAALVVVALLVCHGAFGALHQVSACGACVPVETPGAHHSAAAQQAAGVGGHAAGEPADGTTDGLGHSGYFAVVLALFGAAALKLLLGGTRRIVKVAALRVPRSRYSPVTTFLPRGPAPPLLQVFRL